MIVLDSLVNVLDTVLYLFQLSLVIYIVISLLIQFGIVNPYSSIISLVQNSLSQIHEPILNIVRRYIPMFGNLDLSPLVVFLLIMFLSEILNKMMANNIGISFFPREGIFNQLIATGSFELIENEELKSLLLEIYNHQSNRNYATSYQIDLLAIKFSEKIHKNFRINSEYNYKEGQIYGRPVVKSFIFDEKFYYSNEFYGLLSEAKQNGNDYLRLLDDISENYKQAKIYAQYEIEN